MDLLFYGNSLSNKKHCEKCKKETNFYRVKKRKCYECGCCGYQLYPLKGTIMQSTKLPLWKWILALDEFDKCKNGISARELQRKLDVTYKAAWGIANKIRSSMNENNPAKLTGVIEVDETYIGGKKKKKDHAFVNKTTVFGMVERKGTVRTFAVKNRDKETIIPIIKEHIQTGSIIYSDEHGIYFTLKDEGYTHDSIPHNQYKWANGDVSTNSIEGYWSLLKRSIKGTYIHVSKKWLQHYLNEFGFRYNRRNQPNKVFMDLIENIIETSIMRKTDA